jgi:integrase/recombinase XerD
LPCRRSRVRAPSAALTSTIALWLGHEQERTTHIYLHADLKLKQRALDRATPPNGRPGRYRPPDKLLAFLEEL